MLTYSWHIYIIWHIHMQYTLKGWKKIVWCVIKCDKTFQQEQSFWNVPNTVNPQETHVPGLKFEPFLAGLPGSKGENNQRAPARAPKTSCKPRLKDRIWRVVGMVRNFGIVRMLEWTLMNQTIEIGEDYFSGFQSSHVKQTLG